MTQQITVVDIQFNRGQEQERRLVEELRKSQQAINALIQEVTDLQFRVAALEAGP